MEYRKQIAICKVSLVRDKSLTYYTQLKDTDAAISLAKAFGFDSFAEEVVGVFCLDCSGGLNAYFEVARGGLTEAAVHPREVFKRAMLANAASIILVHNHPSGKAEPRVEAIALTKRFKEVGELLGIKMLDHIIIGDGTECSMQVLGHMQ